MPRQAAQIGPFKLVWATVADPVINRVVRSLLHAVDELQKAGGLVHENVVLLDNSDTTIAHLKDRKPIFVYVSPPRNAVSSGRITEVRSEDVDRNRFIVLGAYGWGADVVVDVWVI